MQRSWKTWSGAGLVAATLALGCNHTRKQTEGCSTCGGPGDGSPPASVVMNTPAARPADKAVPTPTAVPQVTTPKIINLPPATASSRPVDAVPTQPARRLPVIINQPEAASPAPLANPAPVVVNQPAKVVDVPPAAPAPPARPEPVTSLKISPPQQITVPQPAAETIAPGGSSELNYRYSLDYTMLTGELHYDRRHDTWRLRYAPVGVEEKYGGSVTLEGVGRMMSGYKSGQLVRVEGALADPDAHGISPSYRVREIAPLANDK